MTKHKWKVVEGSLQACKVCEVEREYVLVETTHTHRAPSGNARHWVYWLGNQPSMVKEPPCEPDDGSHAVAESITSD